MNKGILLPVISLLLAVVLLLGASFALNETAYKNMQEGQKVQLTVRDFIVFEDDGSLEEMLKIKT